MDIIDVRNSKILKVKDALGATLLKHNNAKNGGRYAPITDLHLYFDEKTEEVNKAYTQTKEKIVTDDFNVEYEAVKEINYEKLWSDVNASGAARQLGIINNLLPSDITGTGRGGTITKGDVEKLINQ
jgi:pyruvate/2-oxoglutarate dehydrogenase complex dihydrolipoamide acyltransferase (E2) component